MITEEFNKVRAFLEKMLEQDPSHQGFLDTYTKLLEAKSKYDLETNKALIEKELRQEELNIDFLKTKDTNNANVGMNQNTNLANLYQNANTNAHQTQQNYNNGMFNLANQLLPNNSF